MTEFVNICQPSWCCYQTRKAFALKGKTEHDRDWVFLLLERIGGCDPFRGDRAIHCTIHSTADNIQKKHLFFIIAVRLALHSPQKGTPNFIQTNGIPR